MKSRIYIAAFVLVIAFAQAGRAQAPAGAPAGSTGQCNDGSYSTAPSKKGACRGHQGVKTWFTPASSATPNAAPAPTAAPKPAAKPAPAAAPAPTPAPAAAPAATAPAPSKTAKSTPASTAAAPGGSPGLVWVNTSSNVYHCYGTKYYGTTKGGKYETEAAAKAAGARPDHGKACGQ